MNKELKNYIDKMSGNVLAVGVYNQELLNRLNKNSDSLYSINRTKNNSLIKKSKVILDGSKKINIKKLYKYFKKKSIDYIICNYDEIEEYSKFFVRDSIYLNNNTLYLYTDNIDVDIDYLIKKYRRYDVNIKVNQTKNYTIIIIDNKNSKNKKIREKFYYISDTCHNIGDFITNILIS